MNFNLVFVDDRARQLYGSEAPKYATPNSCALDLRACISDTLMLEAGQQMLIGSGIKIQPVFTRELALNHANTRVGGFILPRSGKGAKEGFALGNTVGLIDADYQGEIMLMAWARPTRMVHRPGASLGFGMIDEVMNPEPKLTIVPGERVAQLVFLPCVIAEAFNILTEFPQLTDRGEGGLGSTGPR